jgi:hypothetical protein
MTRYRPRHAGNASRFLCRRMRLRILPRLIRRRPRGARRRSGRRADRPRCVPPASPQALLRRGARACADAIRRVPAGSPRRGRVRQQSTRIVQRKRRPTSNVDSMMVLRVRRGGTGSKYVTPWGGVRRAAIRQLYMGGPAGRAYCADRLEKFPLVQTGRTAAVALSAAAWPHTAAFRKEKTPAGGGRGFREDEQGGKLDRPGNI